MGAFNEELRKHTPEPSLTGRADITPDGGEFVDVQTRERITDWADVFTRFNLDPEQFLVVDDTVRMSTWQQSKRTSDGDRDVINLYSYSARFTRKLSAQIDTKGMIESLRKWRPSKVAIALNTTTPVAKFVGWADWQLGKGEGDGTAGTKQRILDGFEATERRVKALRKQGVNLGELVVGNMGDHTEAVTGHYTSQTYSVDLNQRDQLNLAIELNMTGLKVLAPLFEKVTYLACLCNHGQWQRLGGKQITDDSDNATGFIGDTLKTVCGLHPGLSHIEWVIPRDEMITTGTFAGVNLAAAHGHKIGGAEETWLTKQSAWLHSTRNFRPQVWVTAHKHTSIVTDYGPYHRIQCATNDPGSKSFTDGTGTWSTQGTTTFLLGNHNPRHISHFEVI